MKIGAPALFLQMRPGLHGEPFVIYKFRTMTDERDGNWNLLPDGERLTRLGRFLRKTSMDELPELFNVVKGDMSIVGPRPLLMQYLGALHEGRDQSIRSRHGAGVFGVSRKGAKIKEHYKRKL